MDQASSTQIRHTRFRQPALLQARERGFERWRALVGEPVSPPESETAREVLGLVFACSPFLTRLTLAYPQVALRFFREDPDAAFGHVLAQFATIDLRSRALVMEGLRVIKAQASLLTALADIAGVWDVAKVTEAMSDIADLSVQACLRSLLLQARKEGKIGGEEARIEENCGLFVLALGKLGGRELNYSSDIDLIVFFERERLNLSEANAATQFAAKLVQEMVRMLQERTKDGYGFRVDLRLRPDPASTPVALSTAGALTYYETVGQNWERAALIKARCIAGDGYAAAQFLGQLAPFLWRKHLDFAAIEDIQSIKRQMDARGAPSIALPGHNLKTGLGGIREIEFFAQIHQLIWGGRLRDIRTRATCETLAKLADAQLIQKTLAEELTQSYRFLRRIEHRLQMIDDQQTHSLPASSEALETLAIFAGYEDCQGFRETLTPHLERVHRCFSTSFRGAHSLSGEGALSFTGVEHDPGTLDTLRGMGYAHPASVASAIQAWHRGARRATRTKRARELITELTPALLRAFAEHPAPDQAFARFDEFLTGLPAGVQLFSLFQAHAPLLRLIALIMGSAPALALDLSRKPSLLDAVLTADFFRDFPDSAVLAAELASQIAGVAHFEDEMNLIRRFHHEKQFQAGVQLLRAQADASRVNAYLSAIADVCVRALLESTEKEFARKHPQWRSGHLGVIALGRLGALELTFGSDIDLIFVHDEAAQAEGVDGKALYNKLSGRFINALSLLTNEGRLYEVDTRLRPSGKDGALAVSLEGFGQYYRESAWTFEYMALTRARAIAGGDALRARLEASLQAALLAPHDPAKLRRDILDLREKISLEFGEGDLNQLKYVRGGLMDIDFLTQYHVLIHAKTHPFLLFRSSPHALRLLAENRLISLAQAQDLTQAHHYITAIFTVMRLSGVRLFKADAPHSGLHQLLTSMLKQADFSALQEELSLHLSAVSHHWRKQLGQED
jgi:glutamate-ammonia-ligase adenylyltransferase